MKHYDYHDSQHLGQSMQCGCRISVSLGEEGMP